MELGVLGRHLPDREWLKRHAVLVALFLVTAHVAMIAGMLDPALAGGMAPMGEGGHGAHAH